MIASANNKNNLVVQLLIDIYKKNNNKKIKDELTKIIYSCLFNENKNNIKNLFSNLLN